MYIVSILTVEHKMPAVESGETTNFRILTIVKGCQVYSKYAKCVKNRVNCNLFPNGAIHLQGEGYNHGASTQERY